jgi:predicted O-methyltransferase YrrM
MSPSITQPQVADLLETLHADAAKNDPRSRRTERETGSPANEADHFQEARHRYMAVGREFGHLLYTLARSVKAKSIVEFGTSFGVSTIYLACALRDQGKGRVITTEFIAEKAAQAKKNFAVAGLDEWVEVRVGDARESLKDPLPEEIDLIFLDGAKGLYLEVLQLVEPRLRAGALVVSDNTSNALLGPFLDYVRNPGHGYLSSAILTSGRERNQGHEISIRL